MSRETPVWGGEYDREGGSRCTCQEDCHRQKAGSWNPRALGSVGVCRLHLCSAAPRRAGANPLDMGSLYALFYKTRPSPLGGPSKSACVDVLLQWGADGSHLGMCFLKRVGIWVWGLKRQLYPPPKSPNTHTRGSGLLGAVRLLK